MAAGLIVVGRGRGSAGAVEEAGGPFGPGEGFEFGEVGIGDGDDEEREEQAEGLAANDGYGDGGALL